jgi:hypothetical protein
MIPERIVTKFVLLQKYIRCIYSLQVTHFSFYTNDLVLQRCQKNRAVLPEKKERRKKTTERTFTTVGCVYCTIMRENRREMYIKLTITYKNQLYYYLNK